MSGDLGLSVRISWTNTAASADLDGNVEENGGGTKCTVVFNLPGLT